MIVAMRLSEKYGAFTRREFQRKKWIRNTLIRRFTNSRNRAWKLERQYGAAHIKMHRFRIVPREWDANISPTDDKSPPHVFDRLKIAQCMVMLWENICEHNEALSSFGFETALRFIISKCTVVRHKRSCICVRLAPAVESTTP